MKRSSYREGRIAHYERAMGYFATASGSAERENAMKRADLDIEAAEAAGVTWDPEEPEGFQEWWDGPADLCDGLRKPCLEAWNACLAHQSFARKEQELLALADSLEEKGLQTRPLSRTEIAERIRSILRMPE